MHDREDLHRHGVAAADRMKRPGRGGLVDPGRGHAIHRPYFIAAMAVTVGAGAAWGVWLLWQVGTAGRFTGVSLYAVNGHGQAQVFGWVGLFIMGFAYGVLPRIWRTALAWPALAVVLLVLMIVGVAASTAAIGSGSGAAAAWTALAANVLLTAGASVFAVQIAVTFARSPERMQPYVAFVLIGLAWFAAQAAFGTWHHWRLMTAESRGSMLWQVMLYQPVLRTMQMHGLALLVLLGISMWLLPTIFRVPRGGSRAGWWALGLLVAAVVVQIVALPAMRLMAGAWWGPMLWASWAMLGIGCGLVVWPWRLWRPLPRRDRAGKFVRAAYAWLGVSLVMLLAMPVYHAAAGMAFSHAYYGAIRHAFALGFVSLMIVGITSKLVPALQGVEARRLGALWVPFVLLNVGCVLRVSGQAGTDWGVALFEAIVFSGVLELSGLALWALHVGGVLLRPAGGRLRCTASALSGGAGAAHAGRGPWRIA